MTWFALLSLALYFIADFFDGRRVRDEREEMIGLRSLEFAHKASMVVLTGLSLAYFLRPGFDAQFVILALIASALYGEIFAKFYYRWKL